MNKIRVLPNYIIDSIAAGEVIERPYSIVKELLENSIDADSKNIEIHIDNGEEFKIIITDDGKGIQEEDLLCVYKDMLLQKYQIMIYQSANLGFQRRGTLCYCFSF